MELEPTPQCKALTPQKLVITYVFHGLHGYKHSFPNGTAQPLEFLSMYYIYIVNLLIKRF